MLVEVRAGRRHNEIQMLGESGQAYSPEVNWREKEIGKYFLRVQALCWEMLHTCQSFCQKKKKKAVIILFSITFREAKSVIQSHKDCGIY